MNSLKHHGILGQKWGVRRYQNPDGSLTDAGRKRYIRMNNADERRREKEKKKASIDEKEQQKKRAERTIFKNDVNNAVKDTKSGIDSAVKVRRRFLGMKEEPVENPAVERNAKLREDIHNMTDEELKSEIARMNLENQYYNLKKEPENVKVEQGKDFVEEYMHMAGDVVSVVGSAVAIGVSLYEIKQKMGV